MGLRPKYCLVLLAFGFNCIEPLLPSAAQLGERTPSTTLTAQSAQSAQAVAPEPSVVPDSASEAQLHDYIRNDFSPPAGQNNNSVAAFFQLQPQSTPTDTPTKTETESSLKKGVLRLLDNIGVPLLFYKGDELDPSISGPMTRQIDKVENSEQAKANRTHSLEASDNESRNRIPTSELDGVELPSLRDVDAPAK